MCLCIFKNVISSENHEKSYVSLLFYMCDSYIFYCLKLLKFIILEAGINYTNVKFLIDQDISDIFKHNIGHRCQFRRYFQQWMQKSKDNSLEQQTIPIEVCDQDHQPETNSLSLINILNKTEKGKTLLKAQKIEELTDPNRKKLVECIVEFFNNANKVLTTAQILCYSDQIQQIFPKEIKVICC